MTPMSGAAPPALSARDLAVGYRSRGVRRAVLEPEAVVRASMWAGHPWGIAGGEAGSAKV